MNAPQGDEGEDDEVEKMLKEEGEEEGFIVSDGYLSASEFGLSQNEGSQAKQEIEERRKNYGKRYLQQHQARQNMQACIILYQDKKVD